MSTNGENPVQRCRQCGSRLPSFAFHEDGTCGLCRMAELRQQLERDNVYDLAAYLERCEREHIVWVLELCNYSRRQAAKALGISYRCLLMKKARYGI